MASLGLNIHIDKENATPHIGKGESIKFASNKGNKGLSQATPRKALYDVNKDTTNVTSLKSMQNGGFLKPMADAMQPAAKLSVRPANQVNTSLVNKDKVKRSSLKENKILHKKEATPSMHPTSSKASKLKKKASKKSTPNPFEEDGYDSDTIWPRAERLSTHMHKILAWRPPCLLGNDIESDTDGSLSEEEIPDQIIVGSPSNLMEMPEMDMASILASLPDPEKP
ncbi:hypothetical protein PoB_000026800 [Plakobranchus ocellatus]|uniref:Uncharacterized protein n=1 Tax=Plakobranchus ocellatus TaxID=259542 RepID=A0AAV3XUT9_9GAST|nr:hypothetical protein PoB_000026800 [Plakobranchus ocellatus]